MEANKQIYACIIEHQIIRGGGCVAPIKKQIWGGGGISMYV